MGPFNRDKDEEGGSGESRQGQTESSNDSERAQNDPRNIGDQSEDNSAAARGADYVTFTSSSTVRFFLEATGGSDALGAATRLVSIGPITSATLREHALEPHVEAERHDVEGLVAALVGDAGSRRG